MGETLSDRDLMTELLADCRATEAKLRRHAETHRRMKCPALAEGDEREADRWKATGDLVARVMARMGGGAP